MTTPPAPATLRRSSRVQLRIPVTISGTFSDGRPFSEEAHLKDLSKFGARLKTELPLKLGMQLRMRAKQSANEGIFQVVWLGQEDTPRAGEVGIEYLEVSTFLGITFPD